MEANAFGVVCGSLWKFKKQNFHKPPTASLEILKNRISTNALILRKESTASTMPATTMCTFGKGKKEKPEPVRVEETIRTDMLYQCKAGKRLQIRIGSRGFVPDRECEESLGIPWLAWWFWSGEQKKRLWSMRQGKQDLLRPQKAAGSRSFLRRHARLSGGRNTACLLQAVWQGETGETRLGGGQPFLYQAICVLCRKTMPRLQHQGCGQRTPPGLAHGQGSGKAVYDRAAKASSKAGAQGDWH